MSKRSSRRARRNLNRLIVSSYDETLSLDEASGSLRDPERRGWLNSRRLRRLSFRRDLAAAVVNLGGAPACGPSLVARYCSGVRRLRQWLSRGDEADVYGVCARAAEKSVLAYARTLTVELPDDISLDLARHYEEIEADRIELRRLRWAAEPADPVVPPVTATEVDSLRARNWDAEDDLAVEFWTEGRLQGSAAASSAASRRRGS